MTDSNKENKATLFERIGGDEGVRNLVGTFYDAVFADEKLAPFFRGVSADKLRRMQRELFTSALDGPISYTGRTLSHAHHGLGIGPHDMKRFVDHLFESLEGIDLTESDRMEIISRINRMADEVMGDKGLDG